MKRLTFILVAAVAALFSAALSADEYPSRAGLVAPAGTPPGRWLTKLNTALRAVIDSPDVQARFKNVGFEGFSSTPEELGAFMKAQLGVWEKMVKDADIKPN